MSIKKTVDDAIWYSTPLFQGSRLRPDQATQTEAGVFNAMLRAARVELGDTGAI